MPPVNSLPSMQFDAINGQLILITAATVQQDDFVIGRDYWLVAIGGVALCRWGTDDAVAADGGFDFAVGPNGSPVIVRATSVSMNVIEADASSSATAVLTVARVAEL